MLGWRNPPFFPIEIHPPQIVASCAASVPEDGGFDKATLRQSLPWKPHGTFPQKNGETRRFDHEKWRFNHDLTINRSRDQQFHQAKGSFEEQTMGENPWI